MREIKFRAWLSDSKYKNNEQMLKWEEFKHPLKFWSNYYAWRGNIKILMQYTGVKDKNGKEIYEGDIIKYYNDYGEVYWECSRWMIMWEKMQEKLDLCLVDTETLYPDGHREKEIEVIGNIHDKKNYYKEQKK